MFFVENSAENFKNVNFDPYFVVKIKAGKKRGKKGVRGSPLIGKEKMLKEKFFRMGAPKNKMPHSRKDTHEVWRSRSKSFPLNETRELYSKIGP